MAGTNMFFLGVQISRCKNKSGPVYDTINSPGNGLYVKTLSSCALHMPVLSSRPAITFGTRQRQWPICRRRFNSTRMGQPRPGQIIQSCSAELTKSCLVPAWLTVAM